MGCWLWRIVRRHSSPALSRLEQKIGATTAAAAGRQAGGRIQDIAGSDAATLTPSPYLLSTTHKKKVPAPTSPSTPSGPSRRPPPSAAGWWSCTPRTHEPKRHHPYAATPSTPASPTWRATPSPPQRNNPPGTCSSASRGPAPSTRSRPPWPAACWRRCWGRSGMTRR